LQHLAADQEDEANQPLVSIQDELDHHYKTSLLNSKEMLRRKKEFAKTIETL
jgi:hypothetical protein